MAPTQQNPNALMLDYATPPSLEAQFKQVDFQQIALARMAEAAAWRFTAAIAVVLPLGVGIYRWIFHFNDVAIAAFGCIVVGMIWGTGAGVAVRSACMSRLNEKGYGLAVRYWLC
jgi:hypothetical protein